MASLAELVRLHARYDAARITHLQRLVTTWNPIADLCFADLLLFVPLAGEGGRRFVIVGQVRPSTNQTLYRQDYVGEIVDDSSRPLIARALGSGELVEGEVRVGAIDERVRVLAIPVRTNGEVIAVCSRESRPSIGRQPGELERTYLSVFQKFARMMASGTFPFAADDVLAEEAPRVGDGALVVDAEGRVEYASPNAISALHKMGIHANAEGHRFSELGLQSTAIHNALTLGVPVTEEIERGPDVTVLMRCLPLIEDEGVTGGLVLLRDISELRRRDRLLISMDATIREIHHRVKNNLQTISSLLRLQGRRLDSPEAKSAIEESVRRIRSIALVHEILSRETGDDVSFQEIVRPLVRMVEEAVQSPDRPVRFRVEGDAGRVPARVATPLAVVLTELLQNAVDHAFPEEGALSIDEVRVLVQLDNDGRELQVKVADNGVGLPPGFALEGQSGLGLSIVRTLVTSQIEGSIDIRARESDEPPGGGGTGTVAELRLPVHAAAVE
jgi:two-component system, sensor histidine kinase PdtaS